MLKQIGLDFRVEASQIDEAVTLAELAKLAQPAQPAWPAGLVKALAGRKAESVAKNIKPDSGQEYYIIGADTVVYSDNRILGKPVDEEDGYNMLKSLSGRVHEVYTGVAIIKKTQQEEKTSVFAECTSVYIRDLEDNEILSYIKTKEPMDKAGAYGIQGRAAVFVWKIEGCYNNVQGLPVARLYKELKKLKGEV